MYIRKNIKKEKGKTYTSHALVESVRTPKGPRQKVVCTLGDLSPRPRKEWLKLAHKVENALVGQEELLEKPDAEVEAIVRKVKERRARERTTPKKPPDKRGEDDDLVAVHTDRVAMERVRSAGPVHVGYEFWKRLGLDHIVRDAGLTERACTLTCAMTLNRLVHPASEHAMVRWIRDTALDDILGIGFEELADDSLYRNLDKLYPNRFSIESALVERERNLFNLDPTVFFYDLTSTYFEGMARNNPKAKRGYSRDKRPDCKQVVIGLVVGREGFPVAHEVFPGNLQDRKSLGLMLDSLNERVGLSEGQTVVVDRGMAYEENIEEIRSRNLHYVVASRQSERDQWLEAFEDSGDFEEVERTPSPRNPYQNKSPVRVKMRRSGDETHVLCVGEGRKEKDRAIREKFEARLVSDLSKLQERVRKGRLVKVTAIAEAIGRLKERYPRVARYYSIFYDEHKNEVRWEVRTEPRAKAETLDGAYLLRTDRHDLSADEAWRLYMTLTRAETAFRSMKSPLAERPIFHQLQHRVETHIFLRLLAYHLLVAIDKTLLDKGVHTSWATVRETLETHHVATIVLPTDGGIILKIRKGSTPEPQHVELYQLLGVPQQIIRPKKTAITNAQM
jgi:transposase